MKVSIMTMKHAAEDCFSASATLQHIEVYAQRNLSAVGLPIVFSILCYTFFARGL
jgi:hypothetical protein